MGWLKNDDIMKNHHDTQNVRNNALVLVDLFSRKSHLIMVSKISEIKQEISQQRQLKFFGKGSLKRSTEVNMTKWNENHRHENKKALRENTFKTLYLLNLEVTF